MGRLLALLRFHLLYRCFWSLIFSDPKDPKYKITWRSFALDCDAMDHIYPENLEFSELRFDHEIEEVHCSLLC
jgi:hypothetical protein